MPPPDSTPEGPFLDYNAIGKQIEAHELTVAILNNAGNLTAAVNLAEECFSSSSALTPKHPSYNCGHYYADALLTGRGIASNKQKGFEIIEGLALNNPAAKIDLAELYAKGIVVQPDPFKAYKLLRETNDFDLGPVLADRRSRIRKLLFDKVPLLQALSNSIIDDYEEARSWLFRSLGQSDFIFGLTVYSCIIGLLSLIGLFFAWIFRLMTHGFN